jgi:hypothetical protein
MHGAVFFAIIFTAALILVITGVAGAIWLVPVVVVGLGLLLVSPLLARLRNTAVGTPGQVPSGVPTTRDASYEPVQDPSERRS